MPAILRFLIGALFLVPLLAYVGLRLANEAVEYYLSLAPDYFLATASVPSSIIDAINHVEDVGDLRYWANKIGRGHVLTAAMELGAYVGLVLATSIATKRASIMHALRWMSILCLASMVGGILGGLAGYGVGTQFPAYYRSVFTHGSETWFDPVQVGVGLGVSQGMAAGVLVGGFIVLAEAWIISRRIAAQASSSVPSK